MGRKNKHSPQFKTEAKIRLKQVPGLPYFEEPVCLSKIYRWVNHGVYGVILESKREGGLILTSKEAVLRFLEETQ